jgi:hypothetical protein
MRLCRSTPLKKRFIVAATLTALTIGGISFAIAENQRDDAVPTTAVPVEPREQGQVPAPPRPARQKPIERVVTGTP